MVDLLLAQLVETLPFSKKRDDHCLEVNAEFHCVILATLKRQLLQIHFFRITLNNH
jgi:hypothetical protein